MRRSQSKDNNNAFAFQCFSRYGSDLQLGNDNDNIKHQVENRSVEFSKAAVSWQTGRPITKKEELTDFFEKRPGKLSSSDFFTIYVQFRRFDTGYVTVN